MSYNYQEYKKLLAEGALGKVIGVEGGDGTGKTMATHYLTELAIEQGFKAVRIPIIEGNPAGALYKHDYVRVGLDATREVFGMLYSVTNTLATTVYEARKENDFVFLDRTLASFGTYQLLANEHSWISHAYDYLVTQSYPENSIYVDYETVFLHATPEVAYERMLARGNLDVIEQRGASYQRYIGQCYSQTFADYPALAPKANINTTLMDLEEVKASLKVYFDKLPKKT